MNPLPADLHLMRPEWLWALIPALVLGLLLWRQRGRSGSWNSVIAPHLLPYLVSGGGERRSRNLLPAVLLGWILAVLAAAGPAWEQLPQPVLQKQDAMVLVLDLSYSMKSGDLAPSRLDRARQKLLDLLSRRQEGQTALIAYAGDAHVVTPLTDDNPTIANLLPALNPDMMPVPGSGPRPALELALGLLQSAGIREGRILLVTDGIEAEQAPELAELLEGTEAQLSILGVGTATGAPIPLPRGGFLKDASGAIVLPGLEEAPLRQLAGATGGQYLALRIDASDLDRLLAEDLLPVSEQTLALERTADAWVDRGYLLVLLLLPLALALFRRGWIACLVPLLLLPTPTPAQAQVWEKLWRTPDQRAMLALEQGSAEEAAGLFENRDWAGTAAYRGGDYEAAATHFSSGDSADHWYNRGNALARAGQLDEAIEAYRKSLELQPDQADAEQNLALLEQLKQQQEQQQEQQQQQDQQQEQQQDQEQNQQQSGDSQQGQNQQGEDQLGQDQQGDDQQGQEQQQPGEQQSDSGEPQEQPGSSGEPEQEGEMDDSQATDQAQAGQRRTIPANRRLRPPPRSPNRIRTRSATRPWSSGCAGCRTIPPACCGKNFATRAGNGNNRAV